MKYKYYYTYKITCTQGSFKGKFYFGQHKPNNLDDGYFGCGRKIIDYKKKYPNGYIREILNFYDSQEELNKAEYDLIHPWLNHPDCLNLMEGGIGGSPSKETAKKISSTLMGHKVKETTREKLRLVATGVIKTQETCKKISKALKGKPGHTPSEETRKKISKSLKGHPGHANPNPATKGKPSTIRGKHRVYDNPEKTKWHFEI